MKSMVLMKLKKCLGVAVVAACMLGLGLGGYQAVTAEGPTQKNDAKPSFLTGQYIIELELFRVIEKPERVFFTNYTI